MFFYYRSTEMIKTGVPDVPLTLWYHIFKRRRYSGEQWEYIMLDIARMLVFIVEAALFGVIGTGLAFYPFALPEWFRMGIIVGLCLPVAYEIGMFLAGSANFGEEIVVIPIGKSGSFSATLRSRGFRATGVDGKIALGQLLLICRDHGLSSKASSYIVVNYPKSPG